MACGGYLGCPTRDWTQDIAVESQLLDHQGTSKYLNILSNNCVCFCGVDTSPTRFPTTDFNANVFSSTLLMQRDLPITSSVPPCLLGLDKSTEIENELCLIQFFF